MIIQTYTGPNETYTISQIDVAEINAHCDTYMDYLSLANNTVFDEYEIEDLNNKMQSGVESGTAFSISNANEELGYLYLYKVSAQQSYVAVLHTYDIVADPIPKLLLMQLVYTYFPEARYLPKDIYNMQNVSLLSAISYRAFRFLDKEHIKFSTPLWDTDLLDYIGVY